MVRVTIPIERQEVEIPEIASGSETTVDLTFGQAAAPLHIRFDVLRPLAFFHLSSTDWKL
jgi:hypothetical protein